MNEKLKNLSIEYLKSYLSISSYVGCTVNCTYCILSPIKIVPMRPIKVIDETELINNVLNSRYFEKDKTVLCLNNRTDPFITEDVKRSTFKILELLDSKKLKNIVTIITKCLLTEEDAIYLDKFKNIRIVITVTYNGLPKNIQPIDKKIQEETMINISKCNNVKLIHQFRPIIPGINDTEKTIREVVDFAQEYCDATVYQGIRVNNIIKERLQKKDYFYDGKMDNHKQMSLNTNEIFNNLLIEKKDYPIFDHTSCCLSYLFDNYDYNMHFSKRNCNALCKNYSKCHEKHTIVERDIVSKLNKIGITDNYELKDGTIFYDGPLNDEQKSYIKHILHLNVISTQREKSYSEKIIEGLYAN